MWRLILLALATLTLSACSPRRSALEQATERLDQAPGDGTHAEGTHADERHASPQTGNRDPAVGRDDDPARAADSPEISRSAGQPDGIIVLWPRIIPRNSADPTLARRVQAHATRLVQAAFPDRPVDVRPQPERTCPRAGCDATAISTLLSREQNGCVVVAAITPPGPIETTLLPWAGRVTLKDTKIPFREPPESHVRVRDYVDCSSLLANMKTRDKAVTKALQAATPEAP